MKTYVNAMWPYIENLLIRVTLEALYTIASLWMKKGYLKLLVGNC